MATTTAQIAHIVEIRHDWEERGTSELFENAQVELENRLIDAPNVAMSFGVYNSHGDAMIGFAVELTDGTRTFFLNSLEEIHFDAEGNIVL